MAKWGTSIAVFCEEEGAENRPSTRAGHCNREVKPAAQEVVCNPKVEKYKQSLSNGASNHVVFHQNLQSLRNKITELEAVLCNLKQKR